LEIIGVFNFDHPPSPSSPSQSDHRLLGPAHVHVPILPRETLHLRPIRQQVEEGLAATARPGHLVAAQRHLLEAAVTWKGRISIGKPEENQVISPRFHHG